MQKKPMIGLLYPNKLSLKNVSIYTKYNQQDSTLFSFTLRDINWSNYTVKGTFLVNNRLLTDELPFPDVVYNRHYSNKSKYMDRLKNKVGQNKLFNNINWFNKWQVYNALNHKNLGPVLPKTYLYKDVDIINMLRSFKTLFIKPCHGHMGKSIYRLVALDKNKFRIYFNNSFSFQEFTDGENLIKILDALIGSKEYIIQEEINALSIDDDKTFDIRVVVQKNIEDQWHVSGMLSRISYANYFVTNFCYDLSSSNEILEKTGFNSHRLLSQISSVSLHSANILEKEFGNLGELSVDFMINKKGSIAIVEINGMPDKGLFTKLGDTNLVNNVYSNPIDYAFYLAQQ